MKLNLTGDVSAISAGVSLLAKEFEFSLEEQGYPIRLIQREGPLMVRNREGIGEIYFEKKIHFFRALGLWLQNYQEKLDFEIKEVPNFKMNGVMLDASRNAVMNVDHIQSLLRKMAVMGLNSLMLYTEDTYEVKEYPYFGYMRGRYTEQELKLFDDYAHALGIEMIPCIQTLAHLTAALKWNYAAEIKDTADILLVGEPKTYAFIKSLMEAASKPFRSNRIHIGMDEAHQLGLGKYLVKNGYEERFNIMNTHLQQVVAMAEELKLNTMIWSDMYFRLGSKNGGYYDLDVQIPDHVIENIPNTQLVYWDYYHTDEEFYRQFIKKHQELGSEPIFAGGVWTWNGISPNYGKALATSEAALSACKKEGIQEMFVTMWGDNGAETPLLTALPVLQFIAEHSYHQSFTEEHLEQRFQFCTGENYQAIMLLNQFDETPGVAKDNLHESNPSKILLWQDVLIGLYDENIRDLGMNQHYQSLLTQLTEANTGVQRKEWEWAFDFYEQLAKVLSVKAELGIQLKEAYDSIDKKEMAKLVVGLDELRGEANELRERHRQLWFATNKPFGWEVLEIRYGGLIARLETSSYRLKQWIDGNLPRIEELEQARLYFEGPYKMPEGTIGRNNYNRIVTAGDLG
ncbi:beta-N-acetylhexosaminidase [Alkalihalobacillus sp. 1P02AB]|uniref:beta-N-acetylhexosaminidase n=1 Tax=Alkalihalobacillus sp. 1P02AB TaxID=3132260 RepID=UPI0039A52FFF